MATNNRGNSSRGASKKSSSRSKSASKKARPQEEEILDYSLRSELVVIGMVALTIFLFLCNFGICGAFGDAVSSVLFGLFGITAYIAPLVILGTVVISIANFGSSASTRKVVSGIVLFFLVGIIAELLSGRPQSAESYDIKMIYSQASEYRNGGGVFAGSLAYLSYKYLSLVGSVLLILLLSIAAIVVFTQHSFVGGLKKGGRRIIDRTRQEADNYRDYAEKRREKMEQRRAQVEEKRRLLLEQKEDEKILRMEKKVAGVMLDTELKKEEDEEQPDKKIKIHGEDDKSDKNLFIPDEDEFHDDIHEITLKNAIDEISSADEDIYEESYEDSSYKESYVEESKEEEETKTENAPIKLVARSADEPESDHDPLPDVPIHAEHLGNGMNGEYVVHAQDHISQSSGANTSINGASKSSVSSLGPGPHTTSPGMEKEIEKHKKVINKKYVFPPISLLEKGVKNKNTDTARQLKETALKLQETLRTFGVNVTVTDISQGPAVTRFELQPEAGVRVNKIVSLADDIKMNLAASDIRIEAPIPGKAAVGIEVPNKENQAVALRDLLESQEYKNFSSKLAFAVGKDIAGKTVVTDIAKMPHLLIAGATGSGKSVCINTIIMSLIYKADPKDVQMIMIDPKIVELSVYNGIPHLMIPVVTDPKKAAAALNWAVAEMTSRYKKFADTGVRDLKGYNKLLAEKNDPDNPPLPQLVVIVDELADLMMVSANEVEDAICRLTQLARAAGIHLIIATQRPSVDVITGLIKANMPSRIAFAVSSGVDSRTILDINGAEKLLGKGDMLFYPQGYTKPARVQGAFVSDKEVQAVTDFLKNQGIDSSYSEEIEMQINNLQSQSGGGGGSFGSSDPDSGRDEYFVQAGNIIIEKEKASIGMLQRVFKIGFNRAARIMDQLCEAGVVGDEEGTKPRKVLMSKAEFESYLNGGE
ncbi:MAG: DNA translocase FtsK 4TM domain-containing protein [Butyrivibrio sp.]|uniref:DNA translocase FtsK 4TM domain-containing protein n=1 Tax=Butyrivibrio sp. TaxID=28121 RepID=UPI001B6CB1B4|nr:DNA translocase FtsK 4TM domain-containing protein [Butyrivibrio sp.]MBP3782018.1 DNA translocase FtsK 4TM domain-containing protein [Butyrivibrio sp.]